MAQWFQFLLITWVQESYCKMGNAIVNFQRKRVKTLKECLALFNQKTKKQSKQRVNLSESALKKTKVGMVANRVIVTVFWNACGIIYINYL